MLRIATGGDGTRGVWVFIDPLTERLESVASRFPAPRPLRCTITSKFPTRQFLPNRPQPNLHRTTRLVWCVKCQFPALIRANRSSLFGAWEG